MTDNLRNRIAAVLSQHDVNLPDKVADAVIAALGPIPDREFTDQWGHHWEWCGGVTGTWAWRITRLDVTHR